MPTLTSWCSGRGHRRRRTAETRLAHQVLHDDLTGLPNRLQLATQLKQACSRAERKQRSSPCSFSISTTSKKSTTASAT